MPRGGLDKKNKRRSSFQRKGGIGRHQLPTVILLAARRCSHLSNQGVQKMDRKAWIVQYVSTVVIALLVVVAPAAATTTTGDWEECTIAQQWEAQCLMEAECQGEPAPPGVIYCSMGIETCYYNVQTGEYFYSGWCFPFDDPPGCTSVFC